MEMIYLSSEEKEAFAAHFPPISNELQEYATHVVLQHSKYLFVKSCNITKSQQCYCTHCQQTSRVEGYKHNEIRSCPSCNEVSAVKSAGRGRKYLVDDGYLEWYEKSVIDPNMIVALGLYVRRDYSGDYQQVETKFSTRAMYLFGNGSAKMVKSHTWRNDGRWQLKKSVHSLSGTEMQYIRSFESLESIEKAVKGTPFQYCMWERFKNYDLLKFFELASKYPLGVELLTKFGAARVIGDKLLGQNTYRAVNWRAKSLVGLFKLSKQDIRAIRDSEIEWTPAGLWLLQEARKEGSKLSVKEIAGVSSHMSVGTYMEEFKYLRAFVKINKIILYAHKQYSLKNKKNTGFYSVGGVLTHWRDYLRDCQELQMDVRCESVLFPKDLHKAHQETIKRIKAKEDEVLNLKIRKRLPSLKKYKFEKDGLLIRPATSSKEIIEEGSKLKHCVARYAAPYAGGQTIILFVRKVADPDTPYYTVEIKNDAITQCYGKGNKTPSKDVSEFIEAFKAAKFKKTKSKSKVSEVG